MGFTVRSKGHVGRREEKTKAFEEGLEELLSTLRSAAEEEPVPPVEVLERALKTADEAAILHPDNPTITSYVQVITRRLNRAKAMTEKLQQARKDVRRGWLDEAIGEAEAASKLDPTNGEVSQYAEQLRNEREQIQAALERAKKLIDASEFADARKELLIARGLNGAYPPVQEMNCLLAEKRRDYDDQVNNRLDEVYAASEGKEFEKVLQLAETLRASMKLFGPAADLLKQQENLARTYCSEKEKKRHILKDAKRRLQTGDYEGALKGFEEGLENASNLWNGEETEYRDAVNHREEALARHKAKDERLLTLRSAAEEEPEPPVEVLEGTLKTEDEAAILHQDNPTITSYVEAVTQRLNRARADVARMRGALKRPKARRRKEDSHVSTVGSPSSAGDEPRSKEDKEQRQVDLTTSVKDHRDRLDDMSESKPRARIEAVRTTPADHDRPVDPVLLSKKLWAEGDQLIREAKSEPCFEVSQEKFARGLENYRQSRQLYSPPDLRILNETIRMVESEKQQRMVQKYLDEAEALERDGRIVDALVSYQRARASCHVSAPKENRMELHKKIEMLTNRITDARILRTKGEDQEKRGRVADAIKSYRQSLELVLDRSLEERVAVLEDELARAKDEGATGPAPKEEAALLSQGLSDDVAPKSREPHSRSRDPMAEEYLLELKGKLAGSRGLREEADKLREETFAQKMRR